MCEYILATEFFCFGRAGGLNSGLRACKASALLQVVVFKEAQ
jgi:hypothetical protein